ncbi:MAG: hypothetical protein AAF497_01320 [Planctomycetota bacterium]
MLRFVTLLFVTLPLVLSTQASAQRVIPGTGTRIDKVGDTFEEGKNWRYYPNTPKSSRNIDKKERGPLGQSKNRRWLEGPHRGTPDIMQAVTTPYGGLAGSNYSLLMRTVHPGIPGRATDVPQQDDIMVKVKRHMGGPVPASWSPNCVVRVYVPEFDEWEDRTGSSFGFRTDIWGTKDRSKKLEQYWPGIFLNFRSKTHPNFDEDSAFLMVRGDHLGRDIRGPEIKPGWLTLGMSVSPDGACHFYAKDGIEDLTENDWLGSYHCYGYTAQQMDLFFFNVVTFDDGQTWSTPWIIDDPTFFASPPVATKPTPKAPKTRRWR